jgi:hypothetical protein
MSLEPGTRSSPRSARASGPTASRAGLEVHEIKSALEMGGYVQHSAAGLTAEAATRAVADRVAVSTAAAGADGDRRSR